MLYVVNGCFISLGVTPVENCPLPSEDSYALASQITLGPLNLFQGRLHSAVATEMQQMHIDVNKQILSLHLIWKWLQLYGEPEIRHCMVQGAL